MNISGLFKARFVITRDTFYENFEALRLNLNEQRASEKKNFFIKRCFLFFFYWTNRSILMLQVSFYNYFEYLHFFIPIFFHIINIFRFISEKRIFCNYSIFFRIFSSQVWSLSNIRISFLMAFWDFREEKCWFIIFFW